MNREYLLQARHSRIFFFFCLGVFWEFVIWHNISLVLIIPPHPQPMNPPSVINIIDWEVKTVWVSLISPCILEDSWKSLKINLYISHLKSIGSSPEYRDIYINVKVYVHLLETSPEYRRIYLFICSHHILGIIPDFDCSALLKWAGWTEETFTIL